MLDDNIKDNKDGGVMDIADVEDIPLDQRVSLGAEKPEEVQIKVECPEVVPPIDVPKDTPTTTKNNNSRRTRSLNKSINVSPIKIEADSSVDTLTPKTKGRKSINAKSETSGRKSIGIAKEGRVSIGYAVSEAQKKMQKLREDLQSNLVPGRLVWARCGGYPFWPSVVTLDPDQKICVKNLTEKAKVHVRYFGDNGKHGWVLLSSLIQFGNVEEFDEIGNLLHAKEKQRLGFLISPGIQPKWNAATEEAKQLLPMSDKQRAYMFRPLESDDEDDDQDSARDSSDDSSVESDPEGVPSQTFLTIRKKFLNVTSPNRTAKRKISDDSLSSRDSKRFKSEKLENGEIILDGQAPPTPPPSNKDSSDEASDRPRRSYKRKTADMEFEKYFERQRCAFQDENPEMGEQEVRAHFLSLWTKMNPKERRQYKKSLCDLNVSDSKDEFILEDDDSTSKSRKKIKGDKEDKSVKRYSKETDAASNIQDIIQGKVKYPSLFKGLKAEKVCTFCLRPGKLIKCKGSCFLYFCESCANNDDKDDTEKDDNKAPPKETDSNVTESKEIDPHVIGILEDIETIKGVIDGIASDNASSSNVEAVNNNSISASDNASDKAEESKGFLCFDCESMIDPPKCFVCAQSDDKERVRCSCHSCGKWYHPACLKLWPQSRWQGGRLTCPHHICHICSSDNPQDDHNHTTDKLVRCVKCPSAYHALNSCLPAGTRILSASHILCPKHCQSTQKPVNASWCFLCTSGGSLICCETCPTSFHAKCLDIATPDGAYICEDCETGRLLLHGEIVWVKLGNYRWWPARICFPQEIPSNVANKPHTDGEFCVMFLGTYDYHWVHRGRAFLYQEGDSTNKTNTSDSKWNKYKKAVEEANELYMSFKEGRSKGLIDEQFFSKMKPPPYGRIKVNKAVGKAKYGGSSGGETDSLTECTCKPNSENPCAPGSNCLNRILMIECSPTNCPGGADCQNQDFARRNYPETKPFYTKERGWGLKTLEDIKQQQFVIEYVGEIIDADEYKARLKKKKEAKSENFYFLTIDVSRMIDAEPKGNLSRFMNHSCQPNCETQKWTVNGDTSIGLFALRDIKADEELTFNYNLACDGETKKPCLCGASICSGFIGLKVQKSQSNGNAIVKEEKKVYKTPTIKFKKSKRKSINAKSKTSTPNGTSRLSATKLSNNNISPEMEEHHDLCWVCGKPVDNFEEALACSRTTCRKVYHTDCIADKESYSNSKFSCPWHHCAVCNKKTTTHCYFCSSAYCQEHLEDNLVQYKQTSYVCDLHEHYLDQSDSIEITSVIEAKIDLTASDNENETETDKENASVMSASPTSSRRQLPRDCSPRIPEEVTLSSDSEDLAITEDVLTSQDDNNDKIHVDHHTTSGTQETQETTITPKKTRVSKRIEERLQAKSNNLKSLDNSFNDHFSFY